MSKNIDSEKVEQSTITAFNSTQSPFIIAPTFSLVYPYRKLEELLLLCTTIA